jgi:hypothetical protein
MPVVAPSEESRAFDLDVCDLDAGRPCGIFSTSSVGRGGISSSLQ